MKILFALYHYFPHGGLQRDFYRTAEICHERGHEVHVICTAWQGNVPQWINLHVVPHKRLSNHAAMKRFASDFVNLNETLCADATVTFNRIPDADVYYVADPCFAQALESKHSLVKMLPRYKQFLELEQNAFAVDASTQYLFLNQSQAQAYEEYYPDACQRASVLPPGVNPDRKPTAQSRQEAKLIRQELAIDENDRIVLFVGSGFKIKGMDRVLAAFSALPGQLNAHLVIVGDDDFSGYQANVTAPKRVHVLGGRDDVPALMQAADVLLHPAYRESAGMVLLEAIASGLPVITTDTCGHASYVLEANAGQVCPSPFDQSQLNQALLDMLSGVSENYINAARQWAAAVGLYSMHDKIADAIEAKGEVA